jgi:hypothetical protein
LEATPTPPLPGNAVDREWFSGFDNPWDVLLLLFVLFWVFAAIDSLVGLIDSPTKRGELGFGLGFSCFVLISYGVRLAIPARRVTVHGDGSLTFRRRGRRLEVPPGTLISMRKIWGAYWGGPRVKVVAATGRISYLPPSKRADELLALIASANPQAWLYMPKHIQIRRSQRGRPGWYPDPRSEGIEWFWNGWTYTQSRVTKPGDPAA